MSGQANYTDKATALFSDDRLYRYYLLRRWDRQKRIVAFIGLNPSTADETQDDPTIRKCVKFAMSWGYGGLLMLNLYGWRATKPSEMWKARKRGVDIIGSQGNFFEHIKDYLSHFSVGIKIAAWGQGPQNYRGAEAYDAIKRLDCLKTNTDGSPAHPLYLRDDSLPQPWNYEAAR